MILPNIIVESSPGRYHAYWTVEDCQLAHFSGIQRRLATLFSGDPAVHDLPRVMRLPGFVHQKNTPYLTRVLKAEKVMYGIVQIAQHLPAAPESQSDPHSNQVGTSTPIEEIEEMLSFLPADNYDDWVRTGMAIHSQHPGEEGLALYRKWSASSEKYTPGEPERKWNSFKGSPPQRSITLRTLRKRATEHGYQPSAETLSYQDYINFAVEKLGDIKMDILTNELMVSKRGGGWEPLLNNLPYLESYAVEDRRRFMLSTFPRHFARLMKSLTKCTLLSLVLLHAQPALASDELPPEPDLSAMAATVDKTVDEVLEKNLAPELLEALSDARAEYLKIVQDRAENSASLNALASEPATPRIPSVSPTLETLATEVDELRSKLVVEKASLLALQSPRRVKVTGSKTVFNYLDTAVYEVTSSVDHVTDIQLKQGETLTTPPTSGDDSAPSVL